MRVAASKVGIPKRDETMMIDLDIEEIIRDNGQKGIGAPRDMTPGVNTVTGEKKEKKGGDHKNQYRPPFRLKLEMARKIRENAENKGKTKKQISEFHFERPC